MKAFQQILNGRQERNSSKPDAQNDNSSYAIDIMSNQKGRIRKLRMRQNRLDTIMSKYICHGANAIAIPEGTNKIPYVPSKLQPHKESNNSLLCSPFMMTSTPSFSSNIVQIELEENPWC